MYRLIWILLLCFAIQSCKTSADSPELAQDPTVEVYFNHRDTGEQTYTEPYRQIKRGGDNLEAIIIESSGTSTQFTSNCSSPS